MGLRGHFYHPDAVTSLHEKIPFEIIRRNSFPESVTTSNYYLYEVDRTISVVVYVFMFSSTPCKSIKFFSDTFLKILIINNLIFYF